MATMRNVENTENKIIRSLQSQKKKNCYYKYTYTHMFLKIKWYAVL